jgi:hypothetical protein
MAAAVIASLLPKQQSSVRMIYPLQIPHGLSAALNTVLPPARADRNGQDDDAGAPDVGKNHDLADSSVPVTTTNHLTQRPHVKNQAAEWLTL